MNLVFKSVICLNMFSVSKIILFMSLNFTFSCLLCLFYLGVRTFDISAIAGDDYDEINEVVSFLPHETMSFVRVPIINDFQRELAKTFRVSLSEPSVGSIGSYSEALINILDDDG